jgi:hypothetical protein
MESVIGSCLREGKKGAPTCVRAPILPKLLARSYFPFFGPFFSSFLAFFFIRISSSGSAHDRRHRQPFVLDLIYERSRQESRQYCSENEKQAISVWPRGNNPRGSGW